MPLRRIPKVPTLAALAALLLAASAGHEHYQSLTHKTAAQEEKRTALIRFRDSYDRLAPVDTRWRERYPHAVSEAVDGHWVLERMDLGAAGLHGDTARIQLATAPALMENGTPVGLERRCVTSLGQPGIAVSATSFPALLAGIARISAHPSLELSRVDVAGGEAPSALLHSLCLRLRSDTP